MFFGDFNNSTFSVDFENIFDLCAMSKINMKKTHFIGFQGTTLKISSRLQDSKVFFYLKFCTRVKIRVLSIFIYKILFNLSESFKITRFKDLFGLVMVIDYL